MEMPEYTGAGASQEPTIWATLRNILPNHEDLSRGEFGPELYQPNLCYAGSCRKQHAKPQWLNLWDY